MRQSPCTNKSITPHTVKLSVLLMAALALLVLVAKIRLGDGGGVQQQDYILIRSPSSPNRHDYNRGRLLVGVEKRATTPQVYTERAFRGQRWFKHFQYGSLAALEATNVVRGASQPLLAFTVLPDPPSIFLHWEILPHKQQAFLDRLDLPTWLELAQVKILEKDADSRFYLALNVYEVSGLSGFLGGLRAEWSVYVQTNGQTTKSFLVVDARHTALSLDSVNGFVGGTPMEHKRGENGSSIATFVEFDTHSAFRCEIASLNSPSNVRRLAAREWITANDRIYWSNGVADRTYYDATLVDTPILVVDSSFVTVQDSTWFSDFIDAENPINVLVFETGLDLAITPWYNLDPP